MRSLLTKVTNLSQVEHSDVEAINRIMEKAGYEIFHKFGLQDFFYVKKTTWRNAPTKSPLKKKKILVENCKKEKGILGNIQSSMEPKGEEAP